MQKNHSIQLLYHALVTTIYQQISTAESHESHVEIWEFDPK